ncbi:MAG: sulfatase, partial [Anaerolineae bacterium]|jgi:hypothetical protein|nr:sulfatase [Anaerolineae bacterium]
MRGMFSVEELQDITLAEPFDFTQNCRTMRIPGRPWTPTPMRTMLFDLFNDPQQETLLLDDAVELKMAQLMVDLMRQNDAPIDQYERLGLPLEGDVKQEHLLAQEQYKEAQKVR